MATFVWFPVLALGWVGLVLNEILYDPPGPDAGSEFVELYNPGPDSVALDGLSLWFVNGTDPGRPTEVWRADAGSLLPGGFLVVGGEDVPQRDRTADLGLQNGPDALLLRRGVEIVDAVAWGDLPGVAEGAPAPDVAGRSLGRAPDGRDTGDNASDWRELDPSPGRRNIPETYLRLVDTRVDPAFRASPGPVELGVWLVAEGSADRQAGDVVAAVGGSEQRAAVTASPGDTVHVAWTLPVPDGPSTLRVVAITDRPDTLDVAYHVGTPTWVLAELMARPAAGEPEWIELRRLAPGPLPDGWALSDADGSPRPLELDGPGADHVVVAADPDHPALAARMPSGVPRVGLSSWPTLNNSGDPADIVTLFDARGAVVDRFAYAGSLLGEAGRSLERAGGTSVQWFPARPTPGRRNGAESARIPESGLALTPDPFSPDDDGHHDTVHIVLRDPSVHGANTRIHDLTGELVRDLGGAPDSAARQWIWDGTDARGRRVPPGAYVVLVQARAGEEVRAWRSLVSVVW